MQRLKQTCRSKSKVKSENVYKKLNNIAAKSKKNLEMENSGQQWEAERGDGH